MFLSVENTKDSTTKKKKNKKQTIRTNNQIQQSWSIQKSILKKNQLHFYAPTTKYLKRKSRKQS